MIVSDGGFLVALAEMAIAGGLGAKVTRLPSDIAAPHAALFGEDQARYIVTVSPDKLEEVAKLALAAGVILKTVGEVAGRPARDPGEPPAKLAALREAHEGFLPRYMGKRCLTCVSYPLRASS